MSKNKIIVPKSGKHRIKSVLLKNDCKTDKNAIKNKRNEILDNFETDYETFNTLFTCFKDKNTFFNRPCSLRHPHLWYYAHTATFYINKLRLFGILNKPINEEFESLFAIGVDEMSWDDKLEDREWPEIDRIIEYRNQVRQIVRNIIQTIEFTLPITWENPMWPILMGIEHQRIHLETSSVLIRQTNIKLLNSIPFWEECQLFGEPPQNELINVPETKVEYGKPENHCLYGWDNEYGRAMETVPSFSASKYLVSNREFLDFVNDNGYGKEKYWTKEGWKWILSTKSQHPTFWINSLKRKLHSNELSYWKLRNMTREIPMPWNWPVITNYLESKAFCNWKSEKCQSNIRLITEPEWYVLRNMDPLSQTDEPFWEKAPGNINLEHFASECPVDLFEHGNGFFDVIGNVWQHSETQFAPLEGFKTHPIYDDFSVPCFDNKHNMIKGGSWISCGNEATRFGRYAFRRHFFQHAGFRYVQSKTSFCPVNVTPSRSVDVNQQIDLHYSRFEYCNLPNFQKTIVDKSMNYVLKEFRGKAADIGCGVGRGAFELGLHFDKVIGIDISTAHLSIGFELQSRSYITYPLLEEGEIESIQSRTIMEMNLDKGFKNVVFIQNDAHVMAKEHCNFNFILLSNILDELSQPKFFLENIHKKLAENGVLAIASVNNWQEKNTKKVNWLGGFKEMSSGEWIHTIDGIRFVLGTRFKQLGNVEDIPFVRRINSRQFVYQIAELSFWKLIV